MSTHSPTCSNCNRRKIKCDGLQPACSQCQRGDREQSCEYSTLPARRNYQPCSFCRTRKIKCDLKKPVCNQCERRSITCAYEREGAAAQNRISRNPDIPGASTFVASRRDLSTGSRGPSSDGFSSRPTAFGELSDAGSETSFDSSLSLTREYGKSIQGYGSRAHQEILQELDLTGLVTKSNMYPVDSGSAADIHLGNLGQSKVAIKIFRRIHSEPQALEERCKSLYETARSWKRLNHVNVLPFLGIALDIGLSPALISPFCPSGPIIKYLKDNPQNGMQRLGMILGVASGLAYLHSEGIIHGNFCTKKVLIDDNGTPLICGHGLSDVLGTSLNTTPLFSSPIRFSPPEYFSDESVGGTSAIRTAAGDVYGFAMVLLEVLSGLEPFHHLRTEHAVFMHILRGGRPVRTDLDRQVVTKAIWSLLSSLWVQNPLSRPTMPAVIEHLLQMRDDESMSDGNYEPESPNAVSETGDVTVFTASNFRDGFIKPPSQDVKMSSGDETDFTDTSLPEVRLRDLTGRVEQIDQYPLAGGGNSNIYRGKLTRSDGRKILVAIKMIRMSDDGSRHQEEISRRLKREVDIWSRLKHDNILPFIGICEDLAPNLVPVLISPFYKFGHVGKYLSMYPQADRGQLALGVGSGLKFLHSEDVVHGDLKIQNVLVDKHGVPRICDFGISKIVSSRGFTTSNVGTAPYMAPELFFVVDSRDSNAQEFFSPSTTKQSDVYSFALLVLEILTGSPPKRRPARPIVTSAIHSDLQPKREDYKEKVLPRIWSTLLGCWSFAPHLRPSISDVLLGLAAGFARPRGMISLSPGLDVGSSQIHPTFANEAGVSGPFVPQLMHTDGNHSRSEEEAAPIYFFVQNTSECGIPLRDVLLSREDRLIDGDEIQLELERGGPSVNIRLQWPGYKPWSRQISTKDFRRPPGPITHANLAYRVAQCVHRFIAERKYATMEKGADTQWRVGEPDHIRIEDLVLVSLHNVSLGSWQPHLRLRRPLIPAVLG